MSNYNWLEFAGRPAAERYPAWVNGGELWRQLAGRDAEMLDRLLDTVVTARTAVRTGVPGTELELPRLFVSHRRSDEPRARDVAALAQAAGFQVWLDVLDPVFQGLLQPGQDYEPTPREIAIFIEIALLNCTHVIAVITPDTRGSMWVPYEYGRVKDSSPHSLRAACWIDARVTDAPEYLELGVRTATDAEITTWLRQELARWASEHPALVAAAAARAARRGLTAEERDEIARIIHAGLSEDTRALPTASFKKRPAPSGDLLE
jgi:hypothetical protein